MSLRYYDPEQRYKLTTGLNYRVSKACDPLEQFIDNFINNIDCTIVFIGQSSSRGITNKFSISSFEGSRHRLVKLNITGITKDFTYILEYLSCKEAVLDFCADYMNKVLNLNNSSV